MTVGMCRSRNRHMRPGLVMVIDDVADQDVCDDDSDSCGCGDMTVVGTVW